MLKSITLLGSTGSIGASALDVIRRWSDRYEVFALAAGKNTELLAQQIVEFRPQVAVVATAEARDRLAETLGQLGVARSEWPELEHGPAAQVRIATAGEADFVLSAIVGVAGLEATYEAVRLGKTIGLANKETLVAGGELDRTGEHGGHRSARLLGCGCKTAQLVRGARYGTGGRVSCGVGRLVHRLRLGAVPLGA